MTVLDASVLIGHLDPDDAHHEGATTLLARLVEEPLSASVVTLAEVLVGPVAVGQREKAMSALSRLGVEPIALADDAHVRLAVLRADTRLKLPDCCVLLAAEQLRASLGTFDDRLARAARERGIDVVGHQA